MARWCPGEAKTTAPGRSAGGVERGVERGVVRGVLNGFRSDQRRKVVGVFQREDAWWKRWKLWQDL